VLLRAHHQALVPFMALVEQVMTTEPDTSAKRVFWIVDNGSSHRARPHRQARPPVPQRGHGAHTGRRLVAEPTKHERHETTAALAAAA